MLFSSGEDPASKTYVQAKLKACEHVGFLSKNIHLPEQTSEEELLAIIQALNEDHSVDRFIVQLPLPKQIDNERVMMAIDPTKDIAMDFIRLI